jgi:hypothetical protein
MIVTPNCPTTAQYTYKWGNWTPQQTDDTTCGELDQRETIEECEAGLGCCLNHQEINSEVQPQDRCPTQKGDYPLKVLSGVPSSCDNSWINGVWQFVGKTADARPYYKQWDAAASAWYYMYYDKECGPPTSACNIGYSRCCNEKCIQTSYIDDGGVSLL